MKRRTTVTTGSMRASIPDAAPGAITVASLTDASAAMKIQKDIASKDFLDIQGKYLLVSVQQEVPARQTPVRVLARELVIPPPLAEAFGTNVVPDARRR